MALAPGVRLGPYEVTGALGAGGMGEVYRARDTKLNRDVAIKVLPDVLAADAERLARFTREAQTLAALNHPNIATIYGIEDPSAGSGQAAGIVMELVEGDDLSQRLSRGAMTVDEALAIARQIIAALEAAHDLGIVHRDLKPANIKVRHDGTVKVLDFGLAKALAADGAGASGNTANSPTLTARATEMGVILGTAAYMSPEQARGQAVDKRTDVWAFGCVLYEMLAGKKAFDGEDATEIISAVVKSEPEWNALPVTLPAHVRSVVTRCLVKDRKARIPDLSVVRYLLDESMPSAGTPAMAPAPRRSSKTWQAATAAFVMTTLVAGAAWYRGRAVTPSVVRFEFSAPQSMTFTSGARPNAAVPVISPDGRTVAFAGRDAAGKQLLWVRALDSLEAQPLAGTDGAAFPFWSPDSRFLGYSTTGKLMKVAATGGPPTTVCALNPGIISRGGAWSRDGVIIFNNGPAPLYRVPASGGHATPMGQLAEGETGRQFPSFLPGGRRFLYHADGAGEKGGVFAASLDSGDTTRVLSATTGAIYDQQSGHLLFARQATLFAQAFDATTLAVSGDLFPVAERLESTTFPGLVVFSLSNTGVLAYGRDESAGSVLELTWVDRTGKVSGTIGPVANYRGVDLSPDGSRVAAHRHDGEGGDIWVTDVSRNTTTRLTFDAMQENAAPVWSPEGDRIAFSSTREGRRGVSVKAANNTGVEERLFETTASRVVVPFGWSPDGRSLLFGMPGLKTSTDVWIVPVSGERTPVPLLQSVFPEQLGQISPDGKWLAYQSNETGQGEIYVQPASTGGGKWAVSNGGGNAPRWRGDSRELFYVGRGKLNAIPVTTKGTAFVAGTAEALFDYDGGSSNFGHTVHFSYAPSPNGQRFLISAPKSVAGDVATRSPIVVVINWLEGIKK
jgi:eukaryotic-like serine/threonine-protein kinase